MVSSPKSLTEYQSGVRMSYSFERIGFALLMCAIYGASAFISIFTVFHFVKWGVS